MVFSANGTKRGIQSNLRKGKRADESRRQVVRFYFKLPSIFRGTARVHAQDTSPESAVGITHYHLMKTMAMMMDNASDDDNGMRV
jgi:hypothetical protein